MKLFLFSVTLRVHVFCMTHVMLRNAGEQMETLHLRANSQAVNEQDETKANCWFLSLKGAKQQHDSTALTKLRALKRWGENRGEENRFLQIKKGVVGVKF